MAVDSEALLRVSHLTKTYPMPGSGFKRQVFTAVDDLSFEIAPGEVYGLVGESGSGKSTTGRLICGLERADSGSIVYRGHDLATMSERERKPFRRESRSWYSRIALRLLTRATVSAAFWRSR